MKPEPDIFAIERMIEGGRWILWKFQQGPLNAILNRLAKAYPPEALESVRVRRP